MGWGVRVGGEGSGVAPYSGCSRLERTADGPLRAVHLSRHKWTCHAISGPLSRPGRRPEAGPSHPEAAVKIIWHI